MIASDVDPAALRVARAMGADEVVDVSTAPLPDDVEVVIEASGAPAALGPVLHACARGGTVVQVGNLPGAPAPAALGDLVTREITWVGSFRFVEIGDALTALAEGVDVGPVISHRFGIGDAEKAITVAAGAGAGKVMLELDR